MYLFGLLKGSRFNQTRALTATDVGKIADNLGYRHTKQKAIKYSAASYDQNLHIQQRNERF